MSYPHDEIMGRTSLCLIGGTFDRFHVGHKQLILSCLEQSERVQIWLTSDKMALEKNPLVLSWNQRCNEIQAWSSETGYSGRISYHELNDQFGPAISSKEVDSIGCTIETLPNCELINSKREQSMLDPLRIFVVSHIPSVDGGIVSSTRIRDGEIDREGHRWLGDSEMELNQKMPISMDDELKQPFGKLFEGPEENPELAMQEAILFMKKNSPKLIAVGDVCVHTLVEMGCVPDISFVDGMTKREPWAPAADLDRTVFPSLFTCNSPAGIISSDLKITIKSALNCNDKALVVVNGEEDLAPIIVHLLAPLGSTVVYGQPGRGVVLRETTEETKINCRRILDVFTRVV